jgi:short-subunit dehydrogenase
MKKIILVTGASTGIGLATVHALAKKGHQVYGVSRSIVHTSESSFLSIQMDVTDDSSVRDAVNEILAKEGRIDVLINNAGNGIASPVYAVPISVAKAQFEVNFFGLVRVSNAVLPGMINSEAGLIVNVSSIAGLIGLPYQGLYSASKFAIEGYSQSLRMELFKKGIRVAVVNPGDFKTAFTSNRYILPLNFPDERLANNFNAAVHSMEEDEHNGGNPVEVAATICKIVDTNIPRQNYLVGAMGQTIAPFLKQWLPGRLFIKLMNAHYGVR